MAVMQENAANCDSADDAQHLETGSRGDSSGSGALLNETCGNLQTINEKTSKDVDVEKNALQELETGASVESFSEPLREICGKWQIVYLCFILVLVCAIAYIRSLPAAGGQDTTYMLMFAMLFVLFPWRRQPPTQIVATAAAPPASVAPRARLFYLDNLKSLMTLFVISHHILIGFGGSGGVNGFVVGNFRSTFGVVAAMFLAFNQSYFMCLFMFISGYFVPKSFERKGTAEFMKDKFRRLGIPLAFFFFVMAPAITYFNYGLIDAASKPEVLYRPDPGPQWFVQNLLLFSGAYALSPGLQITMALPSTATLLFTGLVLGLVQGVMVVYNFTMWNVPLAAGALPFDIMFFVGGCIASKNRWLDNIAALKGWRIWSVRSILALTVISFSWAISESPGPYHKCDDMQSPSMTTTKLQEHSFYHMLHPAMPIVGRRLDITDMPWYLTVGSQAVFGLQTVATAICLLHWFAHHCNVTGRWCRFFSEGAFGVYILHPLVWTLVSGSYIWILDRAGGVKEGPLRFTWCDGMAISSTPLSEIALFTGAFYTIFFSACVLWPLANFLRKLPGLDQVL